MKHNTQTPNHRQLKKRILSKKAITAIMGTVLLITFAVAVGSVVMSLGSAEVEEQAECAIDINMKLAQIKGVDQLCYNQAKNTITFTIENGKNIKVEGLIINILGTEKAETAELNEAKITKAGTYLGKVPYNKVLAGDLQQIKIIPKVTLYDEEQICTEKALVIEDFPPCPGSSAPAKQPKTPAAKKPATSPVKKAPVKKTN